MKLLTLLSLLIFSSHLRAQSVEEEAMILNQELEFLQNKATSPKVWGASSPRTRSGPAKGSMPGVENLEERFFSDDVTLRTARSEAIEREEKPVKPRPKMRARADGTVVKEKDL
jgi:hypothetical protein